MSHVHVCLVSDQPIPNLTSVLQFRPDKVVLLKTKEMDEKAGFLKDVLKKKKFDISAETIEAYDINNVVNISESLINKCKDCRVSLNITGGTKVGTLGTFQAFYTSGKEIFYVDTKDNKILQISPEQREFPIGVTISITDYLAVYGFQINSYVKDDSYIFKRKELTNYLANTVISKPHIIPQINWALHQYNEKSPLPISSITLPEDDKLLKLVINSLSDVSFIEGKKIEINNHESLRYLKGVWFEEYVYMTAKALEPDEIKLNVTGKWITKGQYHPRNEFDVMLSKGNRLFYISCKTANPDRREMCEGEGIGKEYLYELVSLSDRALGLFGKRMLVSARDVKDPAVKERAKILKVELVDGKNIATLKEKLRQWLNK